MLDTNVYNKLLDNEICINGLKGEFFTTHIPKDELNDTQKEERRKQLEAKFKEISHRELPTESLVWGTSKWGKAKFSDGKFYKKLLNLLERAKPKDRGNIKDALIAETAVKNSFILVTNDVALQEAVKEIDPNFQVIDFTKFIEVMKNA